MKYKIPKEVISILEELKSGGFEAFLVGGCVRDLLMGLEPKDWDATTNAKPEEIQKIMESTGMETFYENTFGTVGVKLKEAPTPNGGGATTDVVEVTTYRKELGYSDKRHPDKVEFTSKLEDDLSRRDFTVNAMAMSKNGKVTDLFEGQKDIKDKIIKTVGNAEDRFGEDALRLMRAVRFSAQLGFNIEEKTRRAIKNNASSLKVIANERIGDEFVKIIDAENAEQGIRELQEMGLLPFVLPELEEGVDVEQNLHHKYTVYEHNIRSLGYAARYGYSREVRIASLLHDIGKPKTKRGTGEKATFYGHDMQGARMAKKALERLALSQKLIKKVVNLIRHHMFYYDVGEVTESSIRRLIVKVGAEHIDNLLELRIAERKGSGVPKAEPYRLRHLRYMIDKVSRDPLTVGMLKVRGEDIMKELKLEPGPKVGYILNALLEEVLDNPKLNKKKNLETRIKSLGELAEEELKKLADAGREKLGELEGEADKELKGKHYVK